MRPTTTTTARWKGSADRLDDLVAVALAPIAPPDDDIAVPIGARTVVFTRAEVATWLDIAKQGIVPINQRRERLRVLARQALLRRTESDEAWSRAAPLKAALNKAWPTQQPVRLVDRMLPGPSGKRRVWTAADQFLVDEANTLLNGTPFAYGHVIVDEAQDHSAVALRVIGRRSPSGSMTLVGDVAQSTTPAGQESWRDVFANLAVRGSVRGSTRSAVDGAVSGSVAELTIGYRVPEPILEIANRLLPLTGVDAIASRSVRGEGEAAGVAHRVTRRVGDVDGGRGGAGQAPAPVDRRRRSVGRSRGDHGGAGVDRPRSPSTTSTS